MTLVRFLALAFQIIAWWTLASIIVAAPLCWLISRGKMDSERRQHGAGNRDPLGSGGSSQGGCNINHGDHMPHAAE